MVAPIFSFFGIKTEYTSDGIHLTKIKSKKEHFGFDFSDCPDLAQTIAVTTSALSINTLFNGLHTLKIKETDRIVALKNELSKLGGEVKIISDNSIEIIPATSWIENESNSPILIETYDDHRMAMAFAALAMKLNFITIINPEVVKKSYPDFWTDLKQMGFVIKES